MKLEQTQYKGYPAAALEHGAYRAVFLPRQGCKLASLRSEKTGREYIYQGKTEQYREAKYGMGYLDGECAGVDEMFPTIDACFYDAEPWKGAYLPDHGEVWTLPWQTELCEGELRAAVTGVRLPYRLTKRVRWQEPGVLRIDYTAHNPTPFAMDFIWAAHMMLTGYKGCRFEFPDGLHKAYTTMSDSGLIGRYGDTFSYPLASQPDGSVYDASICRGTDADDYQKFYFADKLQGETGWGCIHYPEGGSLRVEFPAAEVPYLGAIQAEGGALGLRCMFLEPCTGAFDRPDLAKQHHMNSVLAPYETKRWYLTIRLEEPECTNCK